MKRLYLLLLAFFCLMVLHAQLSDTENEKLNELISNQVKLEADAITSSAINKVFDARFIKVKRTPLYKTSGAYTDAVFVKNGDELSEVNDANSLVPSLMKAFIVNDEQHAKQLQAALTAILGDGNEREQALLPTDNGWLLVQSEWFGEKRGYIVTVDDKARVQTITYSDNLKP